LNDKINLGNVLKEIHVNTQEKGVIDRSFHNKSGNSSFCFSPELLSPQETFELLIEIVRKAQSSEELLDRLVTNNEFLNFI